MTVCSEPDGDHRDRLGVGVLKDIGDGHQEPMSACLVEGFQVVVRTTRDVVDDITNATAAEGADRPRHDQINGRTDEHRNEASGLAA